eukprot:TRINITY_DN1334_c0_g1_i1.p1 TRINITY_DN1334_c0_g1~~TRINITY_DN1334_c0_g1_i1.p1  ORF type:complete len:261 (-),score=87.88 TRINITY_DN1334_c0_g1_i1:58-840(-)
MSTTVIVTGASRGLGLAASKILLEEFNANVVAVSRTPKESLPLIQELESKFADRFVYLSGDVSDSKTGQEAVKLALQKFKGLDGLVLNAGVVEPLQTLSNASIDEWKRAFDVNFFSLVSILKEAIPELRKSAESGRGGRVVFVSSGAATKSYQSWGAYGATKAALNHVAQTLAVEEPLLTSIALRPGVVKTEMQSVIRSKGEEGGMNKEDHKVFIKLHEDGKLLEPEVPGYVMASLVIRGEKDLSGSFVSLDDLGSHKKQ